MSRLDKIYLGTNTKMFKTIADSDKYLSDLASLTEDVSSQEAQIFVIPSYTSLVTAKNMASDKMMIGAQNMAWAQDGQFTGEISPKMLRELNMDMVMIGHSERRHIFSETDEMENLKVRAAIKNEFTALLCIGETAEDKAFGISDEMLRIQLKKGLKDVSLEEIKKLWIAYEPVWAIGVNGKPAEPSYIENRHRAIKDCLVDIFIDKGLAKDIPVLYGGSVNNENSIEIIKLDSVDGLFIGRSAWDAKNFNAIIRSVLPLFKARKRREYV